VRFESVLMTFFVTRFRIRRFAPCRIRLAAEDEFGMAS
jgi:hypothetical protein